jgi:hypothetical protein
VFGFKTECWNSKKGGVISKKEEAAGLGEILSTVLLGEINLVVDVIA